MRGGSRKRRTENRKRETGNRKRPTADRCISSELAAQILANALGHPCSRQSIVRLIEEGRLRGHRLRPLGQWYVDSNSVLQLIQKVLNTPPE